MTYHYKKVFMFTNGGSKCIKNHQFSTDLKKVKAETPKGRHKAENIVLIELMTEFEKLLSQTHARNNSIKEKVRKIKVIMEL